MSRPTGSEDDPIHVANQPTAAEEKRVLEDKKRAVAVVEARHEVFRLFRRATLGYVVMALTFAAALYAVVLHTEGQLRHDINAYARVSCLTDGRANVAKFNGLINEIIITRTRSETTNRKKGNIVAADQDRDAILRYKARRIHAPTVAECNRPILP